MITKRSQLFLTSMLATIVVGWITMVPIDERWAEGLVPQANAESNTVIVRVDGFARQPGEPQYEQGDTYQYVTTAGLWEWWLYSYILGQAPTAPVLEGTGSVDISQPPYGTWPPPTSTEQK